MSSEPLAHKSPAKYATARALRPGLIVILLLLAVTFLALGRWQKVEAQTRVNHVPIIESGWN